MKCKSNKSTYAQVGTFIPLFIAFLNCLALVGPRMIVRSTVKYFVIDAVVVAGILTLSAVGLGGHLGGALCLFLGLAGLASLLFGLLFGLLLLSGLLLGVPKDASDLTPT